MKNTTRIRKLTLNKETLRNLDKSEMLTIVGGADARTNSYWTLCDWLTTCGGQSNGPYTSCERC